jgi:signal transduction histidine kinase
MQNTSHNKSRDVVLIIDDQPINLKVLAGLLNEDYDISIANSGINALKMLQKGKPDLILLDVMMPGLDGFDVCETIKNTSGLCDIPVIFLTGKTEVNDMAKAFACGAVDYIIKPFSAKEVKLRVATHLKLYHAKNQLQRLNEELSKSREGLKQVNHLLEKANREKDLLFSVLSHDLRNPLSVLSGYAQIIQQSIAASQYEKLGKYAGYVTQSAQKINELVDQLFQYARAGNYMMQFNPVKLDLQATVKEIFSYYLETAQQKSIHFQSAIPENMTVEADNYMFNTILRNLIGNAIKFSFPNGTIRVAARDTGNQTMISISDQGIGMNAKTLKNLFSITGEEGRKGTAGEISTSLGLQLCKDFIEKHNGTIHAESEENKGATFYLTLPQTIIKT